MFSTQRVPLPQRVPRIDQERVDSSSTSRQSDAQGMHTMADHVECEICGSVYERTFSKVNMRDRDHIDCDVCDHRLEAWDGSRIPRLVLIERHDRHTSQL